MASPRAAAWLSIFGSCAELGNSTAFFDGRCYALIEERLVLFDVPERCALMHEGCYQATLRYAAENAFIASLYASRGNVYASMGNATAGPGNATAGPDSNMISWAGPLGGVYNATRSQWEWLSGEPFEYSNWAPGQPRLFGTTDECVGIGLLTNGS
ncbi:hypothetical protein T492DRAFT_882998, partial [Pavlovales sp. CCMP2436]